MGVLRLHDNADIDLRVSQSNPVLRRWQLNEYDGWGYAQAVTVGKSAAEHKEIFRSGATGL